MCSGDNTMIGAQLVRKKYVLLLTGGGRQPCKVMPVQDVLAPTGPTEVGSELQHLFRNVSSLLLVGPQLLTG